MNTLSAAGQANPDYRFNPVIFREYDIRGTVGQNLSADDAYWIGRAFASRVAETTARPRICVGFDGRLSSPMLDEALCRGLRESGAEVIHIGLGPTPMLYFATCTQKADGGVMLTGSHNPPDQNGFKFMLGKKAFYGEDILRLKNAVESGQLVSGQGSQSYYEIKKEYTQSLLNAYDGAAPLNVAWDAGNGAAGDIMAQLCALLPGAHLPINHVIDGMFPAHHPDPTVAENLEQLMDAVKENKLDLGIAFDGDGDRIGVIDGEGEILWGDQILMLLARDVLTAKPGAAIIADVKASEGLFDEVRRLGGNPIMWKTGHSLVKSKMVEVDSPLAGEMSGHIFYGAPYYGYDDALLAAVRLISYVSRSGESLAALRKALPVWVNTPEIRFHCDEDRKFKVIEEVRARLEQEGANFSPVDGVRVNRAEGWWLLRASNTQPMLVARCESSSEAGLAVLKNDLKQQLEKSKVRLP